MKVRVRLFAVFREIAGTANVILEFNNENITVRDVIEKLKDSLNEKLYDMIMSTWERHSSILILVNGHNIRLKEGLDTKIKDGDEIAIFPPGAGG